MSRENNMSRSTSWGGHARSPFLLLAVALMALAVFFVHDSQPAQAGHGVEAPVLSELFITGTVTRDGETYTFPLVANPAFSPHTADYTIRVPNDLQSITFYPSWTDNAVQGVRLLERAGSAYHVRGSTNIQDITASGNALTNSSTPSYPTVRVRKNVGNGNNDGFHHFNLQKITADSPTFDVSTVEDRTYTAGHEISHLDLSEAEIDALRLPRASVEYYSGEITYTATGLPDGLSLGQGRLIIGTPTAATTEPAEVTYTATDEIGGSVSLTFDISVAAAVEFSDAAAVRTFKNTIIEYTVGQDTPISMTLPEAEGGHGTLKYGLSYWVKETRTVDGRQVTAHWEHSVNDDAPGFSFDSSTRTLTSDTGATAPSAKAFYSVDYWAEDENGARVIASNSITVNEAPTLSLTFEQSWQVLRVGESVSVTLPEAEGGTRVGIGIRYELEGVDLSALGLSFNGRTRTISGTPTFNHLMFLTYTATDRNGVSASESITVEIQAGDPVPNAPHVTTFVAATERGRQIVFLDWRDMERATSYVVQVVADDEDFPALPVGALPEEGSMTLYDSQTDLGGGRTAHALVSGLTAGDYKVRVAARNDDGVSLWSNEVEFTVPAGGI